MAEQQEQEQNVNNALEVNSALSAASPTQLPGLDSVNFLQANGDDTPGDDHNKQQQQDALKAGVEFAKDNPEVVAALL